MTKLSIITSTEYHANTPSVFTILNGNYVGCKIYPSIRNNPPLDYWKTAISSDSDRGFTIVEKQFSDDEITKIELLQSAIDSLTALTPAQPKWENVFFTGKIRRGKVYEAYHAKKTAQDLAIKNYFDSIKTFDDARLKAWRDLRVILNK